jgi:molybdenum cofactor cytidylyltransferase
MVQKVARQLLKETPVEAVAIGASDEESSIVRVENRVAAIVLAAGRASRFGSPKQLALWQDKPLLAHVVDAALASQAEPVIVVLGAHAEACRAVLADRPVQIVMNDQWAAGQSTSMRAGLAALPSTVSAALFPLADQPFVTPAVINTLIAAYQQTLKPVVWPEFEGRRGNPVLFDRILFPEMNRISGDTGAKPVLMAHQAEAERVVVTEPGILQDIDRPEDL